MSKLRIVLVLWTFIDTCMAQHALRYQTDAKGDVIVLVDAHLGCSPSQEKTFVADFDSIVSSTVASYHQASQCISYEPRDNIVTDVLYLDRVAIRANMTLLDNAVDTLSSNPRLSVPAVAGAVSAGVGVCKSELYLTGLPMHCRFMYIASGACDTDTAVCTVRATRETDGVVVRMGLQHYHNQSYALGVGCAPSVYTMSTGRTFEVPCATTYQSTLPNPSGVDVMLSVHDHGHTNLHYTGQTVALYRSRNIDDDDMPNIVFIVSVMLVLTTFLPATMAINQDDGANTRDSAIYVKNIRILVFDMSTSIAVCACFAVYTGASYSMFDANTERYTSINELGICVFIILQLSGSAIVLRILLADMLWETQAKVFANHENDDSWTSRIMRKTFRLIPVVLLQDLRMDRPQCYILLRQAFECQLLTSIHAFIPGESVNRLKALFGVVLGAASATICGRDFAKLATGDFTMSIAFSGIVLFHCAINMFLPMLDVADAHALETHRMSLVLPISLAFHCFCAGIITAYIQAENTTIQARVSAFDPNTKSNI